MTQIALPNKIVSETGADGTACTGTTAAGTSSVLSGAHSTIADSIAGSR